VHLAYTHMHTHRISLLNCLKHLLPLFIILLVLLKLLLTLGEQHTAEVVSLQLPIRCHPLHFHGGEDLAEVCIGYAKVGLLQCLCERVEGWVVV